MAISLTSRFSRYLFTKETAAKTIRYTMVCEAFSCLILGVIATSAALSGNHLFLKTRRICLIIIGVQVGSIVLIGIQWAYDYHKRASTIQGSRPTLPISVATHQLTHDALLLQPQFDTQSTLPHREHPSRTPSNLSDQIEEVRLELEATHKEIAEQVQSLNPKLEEEVKPKPPAILPQSQPQTDDTQSTLPHIEHPSRTPSNLSDQIEEVQLELEATHKEIAEQVQSLDAKLEEEIKPKPPAKPKLEENFLTTLAQISLLIANAEPDLKRSHLSIISEFEIIEFTNFNSWGSLSTVFIPFNNNNSNKPITIKYRDNLYINFPNSTKFLIASKNKLRQELNNENGLEAILHEGLQVIPKEHPDHATLRFQTGLGDLQGGICHGMVACFIAQYHQERSKGVSFQDAASYAAQPLTEGATLFASALHLIYCNARVSLEKVQLPTNFSIDCFNYLSPSFFVLQLLKEQITSVTLFDSLSSQLKLLKDGAYFITTEYRLDNPEERLPNLLSKGVTCPNMYKKLHAVALLVEDGASIIFDPNIGLLSCSDPDVFLRIYTHSGYGYMNCISMQISDTVDLLQEPKLFITPNGGFLSDLAMIDSSIAPLISPTPPCLRNIAIN